LVGGTSDTSPSLVQRDPHIIGPGMSEPLVGHELRGHPTVGDAVEGDAVEMVWTYGVRTTDAQGMMARV